MAQDYSIHFTAVDNGLYKQLQNTKKELETLGVSANKLNVIKTQFDKTKNSCIPAQQEVYKLKQLILELKLAGEGDSPLLKNIMQQARQAQKEVQKINKEKARIDFDINGTDMVGKLKGQLSSVLDGFGSNLGIGNISGMLSGVAGPAAIAAAGIGAMGTVFVKAAKSYTDFEAHLAGLQSLTGLSDKSMSELSDSAIEMSKKYRSSASDIVDAMKLIGSQAPELLKSKDALLAVTETANVLAEAGQISVTDAATAITTVMNQMGVSSSEVEKIANILAAGSKQGAADIEYLNTAFEKSGTLAASAGMGYTELAAMIETVAPKFSSADVAGSKISATLTKLTSQSNDQFNPAVVGMEQALNNLANSGMTTAEMAKLVGEGNLIMLQTMIQGKDTFAAYSESLAGTNTAFEQMAINNNTFEGRFAKLTSLWDAFLLTLGKSGPVQDAMDIIGGLMDILGCIIDEISDIIDIAFDWGEGTDTVGKVITFVLDRIKEALHRVGVVIKVVFGLLRKLREIAIDAVNKIVLSVKKKWDELIKKLTQNKMVSGITKNLQKIYDKFKDTIKYLTELWNQFLEWLGIDQKDTKEIDVKITKKITEEEETKNDDKSGGGSSSDKKKKKSGKKEKEEETPEQKETRIKETEKKANSIFDKAEKDVLSGNNGTFDGVSVKELNEIVSYYKIKAEEAKTDTDRTRYISEAERYESRARLLSKRSSDDSRIRPIGYKSNINELSKELTEYCKDIVIKPKKVEMPDITKMPTLKVDIIHPNSDAWIDSEISRLTELMKTLDSTSELYKQLAEYVESLNKKKEDNKKTPEEKRAETVAFVTDTFKELGTVLSGVGKVFESTGLNVAGAATVTLAQAVATMFAGYATATAQAATLGPVAWASYALTGLSQVLGIVSAIKSAGAFADGGIIGGSSFSGDRLYARVNSGEMILNTSQQARLFNMLNGSSYASNRTNKLEFKLKGSTLKAVTTNYDKRINKIR